jgi:hypothetical protein
LVLFRHLTEGYLGEAISLVDVKIDCGSILEDTYSWYPRLKLLYRADQNK